MNTWKDRASAMALPSAQHITVKSLSSSSPEQDRDTRARAWAFVFESWHTKKGDHHDLTSDSTKNPTTSTDKKGTGNADIHGD
jgi:hypothetical protein